MTDRNFEAEFQDLVAAFDTARQQVIEGEAVGTPDAGGTLDARALEAAKQHWRIVKERIIDLLEDWDEIGGR